MIDKPFTQPNEHEFTDLVNRLAATPDQKLLGSMVIKELIETGATGIALVKERLDRIENVFTRHENLFNFVITCYELGQKDEALANLEKIKDQSEINRALIQLAVLILKKEKDLPAAEKLISRVENDKEGYLDYYHKEKKHLGYD